MTSPDLFIEVHEYMTKTALAIRCSEISSVADNGDNHALVRWGMNFQVVTEETYAEVKSKMQG